MKISFLVLVLALLGATTSYGQKKVIKAKRVAVTGNTSVALDESLVGQMQTDKNINFKLVSAVGNKTNQTVAVTILVTNKGPNFDNYNTQVSEFINDKGETFSCESAVFGKNESRRGLTLFATLYTDVPLKTVYFFKGVLPSVTKIKLLPLPYFDRFGGQAGKVEFRDITIKWR
ncbi:hypothetical protein [Hymenobacter sp. UYCo722]|uniref:hypothetical protein n=1 Tax=Hymenobacter sp. UYCo722 TaxID=3156335 RepID=UPI00339A2F45